MEEIKKICIPDPSAKNDKRIFIANAKNKSICNANAKIKKKTVLPMQKIKKPVLPMQNKTNALPMQKMI